MVSSARRSHGVYRVLFALTFVSARELSARFASRADQHLAPAGALSPTAKPAGFAELDPVLGIMFPWIRLVVRARRARRERDGLS